MLGETLLCVRLLFHLLTLGLVEALLDAVAVTRRQPYPFL